ncbi:MAG: DegQ family serine endoprotease [Burkholderiales bacterium]|nr:DegQ family serine endoprotease [Burkholderiales bacterium]
MRRATARAIAIPAVLAGAVVVGALWGTLSPVRTLHAAAPASVAVPAGALPDFTALVKSQGPAVVNISTTQRVRTATPDLPFEQGDPMREFLRRFGMPLPEERQPMPHRGVGSGFIISPDGYILTNAHVVADAAEVIVRIPDKREFTAKVIGVDRRADVALVKIDADDLPAVKVGDSSRLEVGEWVAAIGSPFGLDNTVTAGIVSAKSRALPSEGYVPFIQTDVAINPGNSGGPLFNMAGEVVGINSQIYSRTGGYMGLSFAIPIETAMKIKQDLLKFGKVQRGRLGVTIQPVTAELAASFGLDKARGALVSAVEPDSPADKAGVRSGDIILALDGRAVDESIELPRIVGETRPGTTVSMQVWRQGAARTLSTTVGEWPAERVAAAGAERAPQTGKLGLAVRPLAEAEQKRHGVEGGVVVEAAEGPAAKAGLRQGDVILALNGERVASVDDLRRLAAEAEGNVAVLVKREDARIYLPLRVG